MKKIVSLLLTLLMIASIAAGCAAPAAEPAEDPAPAVDEPAEAPSVGSGQVDNVVESDTVSVAAEQKGVVTNLPSVATTADPINHGALVNRMWQLNVFEQLLIYNGVTGEYEGKIADSWEVSEDGLEYTFHIRDGVYFHNGDLCDAEAVKFSLEYAMQSSFNASYSGCIDHVEVVDPSTVKVVLQYPNAAFLHNNGRIFIISPAVVQEQGEAFGTIANLAGTGPYMMDTYQPDVEIKLVRNDNYYLGAAKIPDITFKVISDTSSALIAFESGDLDFVPVPSNNFEEVKAKELYTTYVGQTTQLVWLSINGAANAEALSNKLVRQAMAYAIDYEGINMVATNGYSSVDGRIFYADWTQGITPDAEYNGIRYEYNVDKAKELLTEAGYADGVDVGQIWACAGSVDEKIAQALQACWEAVGIKCEVMFMETATFLAEVYAGNFDSCVGGVYWLMDADQISAQLASDGDEAHLVKVAGIEEAARARYDELLVEGRKTSDADARKEIYYEVEQIAMDAAVFIPLYHTGQTYAWNKNLVINTEKSYTYEYYSFWDAYWVE